MDLCAVYFFNIFIFPTCSDVFPIFACGMIHLSKGQPSTRGYRVMGNNALEQLKRETKDDVRLYNCIKELYEQGVPFNELKALIPDIRRTREQLYIKRMLENNNEVLLSMISKEMSFLLDAKERQQEEEFKKLDQLIRQQQSFRKSAASAGPIKKLKHLFLPA